MDFPMQTIILIPALTGTRAGAACAVPAVMTAANLS